MRKKTPDTSKLSRTNAAPYTLRKSEPSDKTRRVAKPDKPEPKPEPNKAEKDAMKPEATAEGAEEGTPTKPIGGGAAAEVGAAAGVEVRPTDGAPKLGDGAKSATHNEPPTDTAVARAPTVSMTPLAPVGAPPPMPVSDVEEPTHMPGATAVPGGAPTDPALPPGRVPSGDSRSMRRGAEFALVYRQGTFVITRFGTVGQRGQWRVVEYPTAAAASHSYAKECSRFVADGFSDYRA